MRKLLLLLALAGHSFLFAQTPHIVWQRCLGGTSMDEANSIKQTSDGGVIVCGSTKSTDGDVTTKPGTDLVDAWVVKLSSSGSIEWQKRYGGTLDDVAYDIAQTSDGGYVFAGYSMSADGDATTNYGSTKDVWVVKLSSTGVLEWQKSYGGSQIDIALSISVAVSGDFYVAGQTTSFDGDIGFNWNNFNNDWFVFKLSSTGSVLWHKGLGSTFDDGANVVKATSDGGCIVSGSVSGNSGDISDAHGTGGDYHVAKFSATGGIEWHKSYGGTSGEGGMTFKNSDIEITSDLGYVMIGTSPTGDGASISAHGAGDVWVMKLSSTGSIQWQKLYGGSLNEGGCAIATTPDGGYICTGYSESSDGDLTNGPHGTLVDLWTFRVSSTGVLQWQQSLGTTATDVPASVKSVSGGYIIAAKVGSGGDMAGCHGNFDGWVAKINEPLGIAEVNTAPIVSIVPNPAKDILSITGADKATIQLYDATAGWYAMRRIQIIYL